MMLLRFKVDDMLKPGIENKMPRELLAEGLAPLRFELPMR